MEVKPAWPSAATTSVGLAAASFALTRIAPPAESTAKPCVRALTVSVKSV